MGVAFEPTHSLPSVETLYHSRADCGVYIGVYGVCWCMVCV